MVHQSRSMANFQSTVFSFLLFILCPCLAFTQGSDELYIKKRGTEKIVVFKNNTPLRVVTLNGEVIRGRIIEVNNHTLVLGKDTTTVQLDDIAHLRRTSFTRPVLSAIVVGGTVLVVFGTAAWASSIGSPDVWSRLGAVIGALIAIGGGIINSATIPVLLRTRKFKVSGDRANWEIVH